MDKASLSNIFKAESFSETVQKHTETPPVLKGRGIGLELLPIFRFLRVIGRCPMLFETTTDSQGLQKVNYEFKFCRDIRFILSAFSAVFISLCCVLELIHSFSFETSVFGELWPTNAMNLELQAFWIDIGPLSQRILMSFESIQCCLLVIEYFVIWLTSPMLSTWLNNWNDIDEEFRLCFGNLYDPNLSKVRYYSIPYILLPTIIIGLSISFSNLDIRYPFGVIVLITYSFVTTACYQAEETKVILMFKALEISMKQVTEGVRTRLEMKSKIWDEINSTNQPKPEIHEVQSWHRILIKIRKQAVLVGKYLAVHQILIIAMLIYFEASTLFVMSNLIGRVEYGSYEIFFITGLAVGGLIYHARLFIKIYMAAQIAEEERRLADFLKDLELVEDDVECRYEMRCIHKMISHWPTEISLNNYVTLNNSLILGIFGQVLTLFIVYQQFKSSP